MVVMDVIGVVFVYFIGDGFYFFVDFNVLFYLVVKIYVCIFCFFVFYVLLINIVVW